MKLLFSLFSIIVVVLAGLLVVPSFIDWSQYSGDIKHQIEKSTGYKLDFNGAISAAFLPTPHVTIENVHIDSAGVKGPVGFKGQVGKASVSVELMPLLSGNIAVSDVTFTNPVFDVREQKGDTAEQQKLEAIQNANQKGADTQKTPNIELESVNLEGVKLSYYPLSGDKISVELPKFRLSAESLKGPFGFNGRVIYGDFDVNTDGGVGTFNKKEPLSINVNIDGGAYALSYKGIADLNKDLAELQGELNVKANSIQSLAGQLGAKDIQIKDQSFELSGLIAGNAKNIRLDNGQLNLGNAKGKMDVKFNYAVEGKKGAFKLQNIPGGGMIDMDIAVENETRLDGQLSMNDIKAFASDTLGVVDAKIFDNPQVPNTISGDINASLGNVMTLVSNDIRVGDYKLSDTKINYETGDKPTVKLSIGSLNGAKINASGALDMAQGVNVLISHPNAVKFIQIFQKDFKSSDNLSKPFSFSGVVKTDQGIIDVANMVAKIGPTDAKGTLSFDGNGQIPTVKADLQFGHLDARALATGKTSSASMAKGSSGASSAKASTGAPWTRDAIDTSALRSMNLDLTAKAKKFVYGPWVINNPKIDIDLNDGVLNIQDISGGLFGGSVSVKQQISAKAEGAPITISGDIAAQNVDLSQLVRAAMSQSKERVTGKGSFDIKLSTSGLSSSALIYGLNADGKITTGDMVVKGIDLAKVTEAISDESLTDLADVVRGAFKTGETAFESLNHPLIIREGAMPLNKLTLVSSTANIIADGTVNFASWNMNVKNTVDFTNPDDLPSVDMMIKGPLNAPKQSVANDILISFIKNKYGAKIQKKVNKLIGDKLGNDSPAGAIINNLLGLPQEQAPNAPVNDNNMKTEPQAVTPTEQKQQKPKLEEQLIKGLFDQLAK